MYHHPDLLEAEWWQAMQQEIRTGGLVEVLSYANAVRFALTGSAPDPPAG